VKRYDRRSITSAENGRKAWGKNLETQIIALANSTKDERLKFDALKYLYDRHAGKPYIATNPAERKGRSMIQDNRLQVAIQQLIMPPSKPVLPAPKQSESVPSGLPSFNTADGPSLRGR
jgi:hypothetical protein